MGKVNRGSWASRCPRPSTGHPRPLQSKATLPQPSRLGPSSSLVLVAAASPARGLRARWLSVLAPISIRSLVSPGEPRAARATR